MPGHTPDYRLIWFQHFHKAAGTTVVALARANGEVLYPGHRNGSPVDAHGDHLPVWAYDSERLADFVDHCQELGCTFVAIEWGVADLEALGRDPRVMAVTVIREPLERFVSNYLFDFRLGYTDHEDIAAYVGSKRSFSQFNYYTRMLARVPEGQPDISEVDHRRALSTLEQFDFIEIMGREDWTQALCLGLGWRPTAMHENRSGNPAVQAVRHLLRGRLRNAWRHYRASKLCIQDDFRSRFSIANQMDQAIFERSLAIAGSQKPGRGPAR